LIHGPKRAMKKKKHRIKNPVKPILFPYRTEKALLNRRERVGLSSGILTLHPRIENHIEQIGKKVRHDHADTDQ